LPPAAANAEFLLAQKRRVLDTVCVGLFAGAKTPTFCRLRRQMPSFCWRKNVASWTRLASAFLLAQKRRVLDTFGVGLFAGAKTLTFCRLR